MSVWLRRGSAHVRLDLLARLGRPPVVAPPARCRRALAREAAACGVKGHDEQVGPEALDRELERARFTDAFVPKAARARRICLVIPESTRLGPWQDWAEATADWLKGLTPRAEVRTILIATGVHAPSIPREAERIVGWEIVANGQGGYASHRDLGRTGNGTPVRLHPRWVDADLRVVLGDVSFHYFAGFGGGRKLVFPGVAEPEGIGANHRRSLDENGRFCPEAAPGRLEGNPVHEDLLGAVSFCPPDLLVQLVEPEVGREALLQIGDWKHVHHEGCTLFLKGHELQHTVPPDLLIADAGGTPRDATFLQAHKSLQHAARFLAPGGRLLLVAALDQGVGSESLEQLWASDTVELSKQAVID